MNSYPSAPQGWPESAVLTASALSGVLVAGLAVMYLLVTEPSLGAPEVADVVVTVTEDASPGNQMDV